jgi:hypothetical protein
LCFVRNIYSDYSVNHLTRIEDVSQDTDLADDLEDSRQEKRSEA